MTDQYRAITESLVAHSNARYGRALYSTHVVMRERYCANLISLALCACQAADYPVERHDLLNRQASVDGRKNALRIIGIEPMIGLHGDDVRTQLARLARKRAGLDAERLGGVAGRDRNGGIGSRAAVVARFDGTAGLPSAPEIPCTLRHLRLVPTAEVKGTCPTRTPNRCHARCVAY